VGASLAGEGEGMVAVGLVLGAGGVVGQAYHAGVLASLEQCCGWDARQADVIVGTSAGSITGTLLRGGVPASDLAAWTVQSPLSVEGEMLRELFGDDLPELEPLELRDLVRPPRIPTRELVTRALRRPWQFRPASAVMSLVAPGRLDILEHLEPLRAIEGPGWPERDLWICAVRRRDGRRVVFGREGSPMAPLHRAVAASCAIPGYFAPIRIGDRSYVDGGVHSPTNAAVLRDRNLDLVVVVSPMSGARGVPRDLDSLLRQHSQHRLDLEVTALRDAGATVVVFEPGPDERAVMGTDLLSRSNAAEVVRAAYRATRARSSEGEVEEVLGRLCDR
jgi:NTE family protein